MGQVKIMRLLKNLAIFDSFANPTAGYREYASYWGSTITSIARSGHRSSQSLQQMQS